MGTASARVRCGWCGRPTPVTACVWCRRDPALPYLQRGGVPPVIEAHAEGRPPLDERDIRLRWQAALRELRSRGQEPTVEAMAEALDRSPRTVREWRAKFGL